MQTWTDASGKFKLEAKALSANDKEITFEKASGQKVVVPRKKLSKTDSATIDDLNTQARAKMAQESYEQDRMKGYDSSKPCELVAQPTDLGSVEDFVFAPNCQWLAILNMQGNIVICDVINRQVLFTSASIEQLSYAGMLQFSPDGTKLLAGSSRGTIGIFDVTSKGQIRPKAQFVSHTSPVESITISLIRTLP